MPDIVLVHGTTQGPAGFAGLAAALEESGHRVMCVDVPSGAADTSTGYAGLLAAQLPADIDRPVLFAHSAGALLLPALARRVHAAHQVWFAGAVADHSGERSLLEEIRADPDSVLMPEWQGVDPTADPVLATYFLFHDADLRTLRTALGTVAPCDLSAVYAERPTVDPAAVASTYILPAADRTLQRAWMTRVASERLGVEPVVVDGGHNGYAARPQRVADIIGSVASGAGQSSAQA